MMTSNTQTTVREAKQALWLASGKMKQDAHHNQDTSRRLKFTTVTCTLSLVTDGIKTDPGACGTECTQWALCRESSMNPIQVQITAVCAEGIL